MAFADYTFYTDVYYGTSLTAQEFPQAAERATDYLNYITRGKATATEPVKRACCALAEIYQTITKAKASAASAGGEVQSEKVGSYSVTYRSGAETEASYEASLYQAAQMYLAHTGLLYRGGRCCRCMLPTL